MTVSACVTHELTLEEVVAVQVDDVPRLEVLRVLALGQRHVRDRRARRHLVVLPRAVLAPRVPG